MASTLWVTMKGCFAAYYNIVPVGTLRLTTGSGSPMCLPTFMRIPMPPLMIPWAIWPSTNLRVQSSIREAPTWVPHRIRWHRRDLPRVDELHGAPHSTTQWPALTTDSANEASPRSAVCTHHSRLPPGRGWKAVGTLVRGRATATGVPWSRPIGAGTASPNFGRRVGPCWPR